MRMPGNFGRWKKLLLGCCMLFLVAGRSQGQANSAQFTIDLTVASSIGLVFNNNPAAGSTGLFPLSNDGIKKVGLDFGMATFPGGSGCLGLSDCAHDARTPASGRN